ncbi:MAG: hypothetical protein BM556_08870 [Bacteriovorax sp. MedPE-SWde]|nr:MAG: hypothetical protein BM556_08870 [Bacteriovorax sp. MedPE-SWde]
MNKLIYKLPYAKRKALAFIYDSVFSVALFPIAILLRMGNISSLIFNEHLFIKLAIILIINQLTFVIFGQYKGVWRYASTHDLIQIVKASSTSTVFIIIIFFFFNQLEFVPRTSFIIYWTINILCLSGGRFAYRLYKDSTANRSGDNCLIVGAGNAGSQLAKSIKTENSSGLNVVAYLDDDKEKYKRYINGFPVAGTFDDIGKVVDQYSIKVIIIAIPSADSEIVRRIIDQVPEREDLSVKILPPLSQMIKPTVDFSLVKEVDPEDLLGRRPVRLDQEKIAEITTGKAILITGAAGSIGSELCRQIARFNPSKVIMFDISEYSLYKLEMNIKREFPEIEFIPTIGTVTDVERLYEVFQTYSPSIVFHAAAFKHVPLMEQSVKECIKNNIFGTKKLVECCINNKIEDFILISTDKAVNPTNVMGASKRAAEMICQNKLARKSETRFTVVRFGNVLASKGSVVPLFKEQIEMGGPVTITHKDITRYFMSIPEACQLVLESLTLGKGDDIFVLDMGEPVKIVTLAEDLIKLSGFRPYKDIKITFTGLRPGEKLYEELFDAKEKLDKTSHKLVYKAMAFQQDENLEENLEQLEEYLNNLSNCEAKKFLKETVKTYSYNDTDENENEEERKLQ